MLIIKTYYVQVFSHLFYSIIEVIKLFISFYFELIRPFSNFLDLMNHYASNMNFFYLCNCNFYLKLLYYSNNFCDHDMNV